MKRDENIFDSIQWTHSFDNENQFKRRLKEAIASFCLFAPCWNEIVFIVVSIFRVIMKKKIETWMVKKETSPEICFEFVDDRNLSSTASLIIAIANMKTFHLQGVTFLIQLCLHGSHVWSHKSRKILFNQKETQQHAAGTAKPFNFINITHLNYNKTSSSHSEHSTSICFFAFYW